MRLPVMPPVSPMLAKSVKDIPNGSLSFEPKWDGFRSIVFRDGAEVEIGSRNGRPMTRYFPEVVDAVLANLPERCVLDGEIVVVGASGDRLDFEALQQRIHPAASRVALLSQQTPARFVAFDLLEHDGKVLLDEPFAGRRDLLEGLVTEPVGLTPRTLERREAEPWLQGAEGVIAKELDAPYRPGERMGMVKVKRVRTIDSVVVGWRPGKEEGTLGSLILGLYDDDDGELRVVGHTSGFRAKQKRELPGFLAPYETGERGSGDPSRWDSGRELEWINVRPELVAEVSFDHVSGHRIRHGAKFKRWREDKPPQECTLDQLQT